MLKKEKKYKIKFIFSTLFAIAVIGYCLSQIKVSQFAHVLLKCSWGWLFLGLMVTVLNIFIRAYRFRVLIPSHNPGLRDLFKIQCLFSMLTYLLPFKSGEVSFIYLMKNNLQVQLEDSTAMLVIARVFDYMMVSFLFFIMLFLMWERIPYKVGIIISPVILILVFVFLVLFITIWKSEKINDILRNQSKRIWISNNSIFKVIVDKLMDVIVSIRKIHEKKVYTKVVLLSLLSWIMVAISFYIITKSVGYELSYIAAMCLTVLIFPISFIQGIGNLGTHEAEWIPVLILFGFTQENAIIISLASHIIIIFYFMLIAGYAWLALKFSRISLARSSY